MIKKLLLQIGKTLGKQLINWGANIIFAYVDKNKDGQWSKKEINIVIATIRAKATKLKNKSMK